MRINVSHKSKQFFALVIKLSIVIGAAYFIYNKLANSNLLDFNTFISQLKASNIFNIPTILILFLATFCNWFLEILRWKTLVSHITKISIWESTAQSLGSLTASLFTPNRVGEYGAKALFFKKYKRTHVMGLNLLGNLVLLFITLFFGAFGFAFFVSRFHIELPWHKIARLFAFLVVLGLFFFLSSRQKRFRIKGYSWKNLKDFIKNISTNIHLKNIGIALLRYLIFSHQFYFILLLFGANTPYVTTISTIATMYFITSIIPMLFIFDVVVKGSVAVWLFSYLQIAELQILSVVALMWILNFVAPSLLGSYFVLNFKPSYNEDKMISL